MISQVTTSTVLAIDWSGSFRNTSWSVIATPSADVKKPMSSARTATDANHRSRPQGVPSTCWTAPASALRSFGGARGVACALWPRSSTHSTTVSTADASPSPTMTAPAPPTAAPCVISNGRTFSAILIALW
jgi:hypothetical protein